MRRSFVFIYSVNFKSFKMKTFSIFATIIFSFLFTITGFAQQGVQKDTIKVWGNCGMCKKKIEKSAKAAGATTASWDAESKMLQVSYAPAKTSGTKIQQAIALTGYDTQDFKADDKAYIKLDACCQYDRKEEKPAVQ